MNSVFDEVDHIDVSDANVIVFKSIIDRDMKHASREKSAVIPHRDLSCVSTATNDDNDDCAWADSISIPFFKSMVIRTSKCGWKPSANAKSDAEKFKEFTAHMKEVTEQGERKLQEKWDRQDIEVKKSRMHITCPCDNDSE